MRSRNANHGCLADGVLHFFAVLQFAGNGDDHLVKVLQRWILAAAATPAHDIPPFLLVDAPQRITIDHRQGRL